MKNTLIAWTLLLCFVPIIERIEGGVLNIFKAPKAGPECWICDAITQSYDEQGSVVAVKSDISSGRDVNAKMEDDGSTPLHFAATKGYLQVMKILIDNGANVNAKNKNGLTPLHYAVDVNYSSSRNCEKVVKLLMDNGADISIKGNNGLTPLDLATINGYLDVMVIIKKATCKESDSACYSSNIIQGAFGIKFGKYITPDMQDYENSLSPGNNKFMPLEAPELIKQKIYGQWAAIIPRNIPDFPGVAKDINNRILFVLTVQADTSQKSKIIRLYGTYTAEDSNKTFENVRNIGLKLKEKYMLVYESASDSVPHFLFKGKDGGYLEITTNKIHIWFDFLDDKGYHQWVTYEMNKNKSKPSEDKEKLQKAANDF